MRKHTWKIARAWLWAILSTGLIQAQALPSQMLHLPNAWTWLNVPNPPLIPPLGITVEAWTFYDPSAPGGNNKQNVLRRGDSYILRRDGGQVEWVVTTSLGPTQLETPFTPSIPALQWVHLAGTWDGATMRIFVDGTEAVSTPKGGTLSLPPSWISIGGGQDNTETWRGYLDEVRLWNAVRSGADLQSAMFKRVDFRPGLISAWHFDGNYQDATGGFHAVPFGATALLPSTSPVVMNSLSSPAVAHIGQPITFEIFVAPPVHAYLLELSVNGSTPGIPLQPPLTGTFPLNPPLLYQTFGALLPSLFTGFVGLTASDSRAFPQLNVPFEPWLIGWQFWAAFAIIDPYSPYSYGGASNAIQFSVGP